MLKKGPTVCDGVVPAAILFLHRRCGPAAQDDIKSKAESSFRRCGVPIERGDQALAGGFLRNTVIDRIEFQERVAGKIHLCDESRGERRAEYGKVNVLRTPRIVMVSPGIGARPDGDKTVAAFFIGECLAHARKIGIERRIMLIYLVQIAPGSVCLPDFNERIANRPVILIEQTPTDYDSLAERLALVLECKIKCPGRHKFGRKSWAGYFGKSAGERNQRHLRRSLDRRHIRRMQEIRLCACGGPAIANDQGGTPVL